MCLDQLNFIGFRSCCDEGRPSVDTRVSDYRWQHWPGIKGARIFNTYGPIMYDNNGQAVSSITVQAAGRKLKTIPRAALYTHAFRVVHGVADAFVRLLHTDDDYPLSTRSANRAHCQNPLRRCANRSSGCYA